MRRHDRKQQVGAGAERRDAEPLAPQVADGPDGFVGEQLEAAGMDARERRGRLARGQLSDDPRRGFEVEVGLAPGHDIERRLRHVADIGEALRAQQRLGGVHRRTQMPTNNRPSRIVVVSGGGSSASDTRTPRPPAAMASDSARQEMAAGVNDLHEGLL